MNEYGFLIRPLLPADRNWVRLKTISEWGAEVVIAHGKSYFPADLPGFCAEQDDKILGLLTYRIHARSCEVITINSWCSRLGIGSALIAAARQVAEIHGCRRLFLVTTNNNLNALRFYQKHGFVISAVRLNAITKSRSIKPQIPLHDEEGLPIRDEIELELKLR
jgi:ribosomal protein S18 acetylase RimI-like enzyme